MWYTIVVFVDLVLFYIWSEIVLWLLATILSAFGMWNPLIMMAAFWVGVLETIFPLGLVALLRWIPNILTIPLYYLIQLPESPRFRNSDAWHSMRVNWFSLRSFTLTDKNTWKQHDGMPSQAANEQTMYVVAPHSIFAEHLIFCMVLNPLFERVTVLCTSLLFALPICREFASLAGAQSATSANISRLLDEGRSVLITPEGMRGAMHTNESLGWLRVLKGIRGESEPRKGFVRLALGTTKRKTLKVVPVYFGGTQHLYRTILPWPWFQRILLRRLWYPWPICALGWYGSFWPSPTPLRCWFGAPIAIADDATVDSIYDSVIKSFEQLSEQDHTFL